jgi:hypothetical protein
MPAPPNFGVGGYGQGGQGAGIVPSIGYYLSLLTSQYQNSPNFLAWTTALLQPLIDAGVLIQYIVNDFDLDAALGPQLDVVGQLVGASRTLPFQPSNGVSPVLTDSVYKILLKAKIAQNQWNGQIDSLYMLWGQLFPGGKLLVVDNQNMSATIFISGVFSSITSDLVLHGLIVPRPEGVEYTYAFGPFPAFGFGSLPSYVAGFGTGKWNA